MLVGKSCFTVVGEFTIGPRINVLISHNRYPVDNHVSLRVLSWSR